MPTKIVFIYFGDDLFNKLKILISDECQESLFQNLNCTVFNFLKESSYLHVIDEVFLSWSHLLIKVGEKIYHCGFNKSESSDNVHEVFCEIKNGSILKIICGLQISFFVTNNGHCYVYSHVDFQSELIDFGSPDVKIKDVAVGDMHTVAVTENGEVFNINLQEKVTTILLPMPQPIAEVVCGKEHVLILSNLGQVFSYGFGSRGQLGHGTIENLGKPTLLDALDGIKIIAIAAGGWHSAAISNDGDLYMWGWNESGQLGFPCSELQSDKLPLTEIETVCCLPKSIEFKDDLKVIAVSCGSRHTAALTENNQVWTWGWNNYGQLGHKKCMLSDKPEVVPLPNNFVIQTVKSAFWSTLITGFIKENYK